MVRSSAWGGAYRANTEQVWWFVRSVWCLAGASGWSSRIGWTLPRAGRGEPGRERCCRGKARPTDKMALGFQSSGLCGPWLGPLVARLVLHVSQVTRAKGTNVHGHVVQDKTLSFPFFPFLISLFFAPLLPDLSARHRHRDFFARHHFERCVHATGQTLCEHELRDTINRPVCLRKKGGSNQIEATQISLRPASDDVHPGAPFSPSPLPSSSLPKSTYSTRRMAAQVGSAVGLVAAVHCGSKPNDQWRQPRRATSTPAH